MAAMPFQEKVKNYWSLYNTNYINLSTTGIMSIILMMKMIGTLTVEEIRNVLLEYLKKKRGMRERCLSCDLVFLPLNWMDH
eukprot:8279137-Ditylum_brightwellii.AAC.1